MEGNWEPRIDISRYQNPNRGRNIAIFAFVAGVIFLTAGIVSFVVALGNHEGQDSVEATVTDVHVMMEGLEDEFGSAYATYTYKGVTYENVWFADWDYASPFKSSKSYRLGETVSLTIDPKDPGNPELLTADYSAAMLLVVVGLVLLAAAWMKKNEG